MKIDTGISSLPLFGYNASRKHTTRRKMKFVKALAFLGIAGTAAAFSLSMSSSQQSRDAAVDRRGFVGSAVAGVAAASTLFKASPAFAEEDPYADFTTTESGMKYKTTKEGDGGIPVAGQQVKTQYTGWLDDFDSIKKFDSSRDRGRAFSFKVGAGQVIRGWDEAFMSMKVGERRLIILPPRLGYGDRGAGGVIPGGATLYFDVELLAIQ
jgi:FKBP-type peptidyl-prolyl cis-trans isomerase